VNGLGSDGVSTRPPRSVPRRRTLSRLRQSPRQRVSALPVVPDRECDPGGARSLQAPLVGDAIWGLDAIRLPSGDRLTDGWIVIWEEPE
jgi:hypothetical protein